MPLTPAEVHNVAFKKPPIGKRGYDEEEVDAFLDIVEVELSRLIEENQDLRGRLTSGEPLPATGEDGQGDALRAELAAVREENSRLQNQVAELERTLSINSSNADQDDVQQHVLRLQQQLAETQQRLAENRRALEEMQQAGAAAGGASSAGDSTGTPAPADHHQQAVQMLALAQQTADQHLAQSKAEAERLLADAEQRSSAQLAEADERARQLEEESSAKAQQTISEAEQRAVALTAQFEQRRASLERRIEHLRAFEEEYRSRLKSYLEAQLQDLVAHERAEPEQSEAIAGQAASGAPASEELADAAQG